MDKVIFIVGPTGVGKTELAIELAKMIHGEVISADSMQAYRHMDIMSQKPTRKQRKKIPHRLINILNVNEEYSAAEFAKRAESLIGKIIKEGKMPIVVGGSGLYVKALIDGLFPAPTKEINFREHLELEAKQSGTKMLHEKLSKIDPEAASKIHPNDLRRIIRALEIFHLTGILISEHKKRTEGIKDKFKVDIYGLTRSRSVLYKRIEDRVDRMFKEGLVKEVKLVMKKKPSITAKASLGYKEVLGHLDKKYSLKEAKDVLKKNTRRFAKRQFTWFKADRRITWIDLENTSEGSAVKLIIKSFLD